MDLEFDDIDRRKVLGLSSREVQHMCSDDSSACGRMVCSGGGGGCATGATYLTMTSG